MKRSADALFAANLPFAFTDDKLAELIEPYGIVISCRIARDREGQSRGYGFVELATEKARKKAIAELNGKTIDGRKIELRIADAPPAKAKPRAKGRVGASLQSSGVQNQGGVLRLAVAPAAPAPKRSVLVEYRKLSAQRFRTAS